MRRVVYKPKARGDLAQIWQYTAQTWSNEQADIYIGSINSAVELINQFPNLARDASHLRRGSLRYEVASHVIFLRIDKTALTVQRILHSRMLPQRHL